MKKILVTGGSGFIGSNFLNMMVPRYSGYEFLNMDKLTYASHPENIDVSVAQADNYNFIQLDISKRDLVYAAISSFNPDVVINFAAESHVDRSIETPGLFIKTNVQGTLNLLEACKNIWNNKKDKLFLHISTDEVYGELGDTGLFTEETPYKPSTPYAASKAASDHLVMSYGRTFKLPVNITNCSNNYGPNQHIEKLIPRMVCLATHGEIMTVHGDGTDVRDWLHVSDHCEAVWQVMVNGVRGESYNVGGDSERTNIHVIERIREIIERETGLCLKDLLAYMPNRSGNDRRYGIDFSKIKNHLGWSPRINFQEGLEDTVKWYLDRRHRLSPISMDSITQTWSGCGKGPS